MKIAAFNGDGSCGVMKETFEEVLEELLDQDAPIADYTFYRMDCIKPLKLGLVSKSEPSKQ